MDKDLQSALAAILAKTTDAIGTGISFLSRELPDVIRQLLLWKATVSGVYFIAWIVVLGFSIWAVKKMWTWAQEESNGAEPFIIFPLLGAVLSLVFIFTNLTWLQILIAPKIYLIEYAASLAK